MRFLVPVVLAWVASAGLMGAPLKDHELQEYFAGEVEQIEAGGLQNGLTLEQWRSARERYRQELFEMLSLAPLPERSELHPVITGRIESDGLVVENLSFESMPGLYVTANLYRPEKVERPLPTIVYLCGHALVKTNGISYGNKTAYQHHGEWFARNGYVCLTLDTIQLGEIEGLHHGTYREGMWWWNSRGYTPAGVEAWNAMRALDYLETRPEVDANRFGVTGRSGGGAYSWWTVALDERIKVAAPVAGITDLRNHVLDGVVEGHCDCMFFVNTYRWDYPLVAALAAPRPLLICNSDKDTIFPLEGVLRTHQKVREIYRLYDASANLGLLITEGPHKDTQDLQLPVFRWFNRHLRGEDPVIAMAATKLFQPQQLKVFDKIPADERTSHIQDSFVPQFQGQGVDTNVLREKVFHGWPDHAGPLNLESREMGADPNGTATLISFDAQPHVRLHLLLTAPAGDSRVLRLHVSDEGSRSQGESSAPKAKLEPGVRHAFLWVRGSDEPGGLSRAGIQIRRRYMLVGQTLEGMRVWDILRAVEALKRFEPTRGLRIEATGQKNHASNLMLAALFEPRIETLRLPPLGEFAGSADYLNLLRFCSYEGVWNRLKDRCEAAD